MAPAEGTTAKVVRCRDKRSAQKVGHPHGSTKNIMFAVRRLQELGRKVRVPLFLSFISQEKAYDSDERTLSLAGAHSLQGTAADGRSIPPILDHG